MEWLRNLNKAIEYIESHLYQEISYDEAAKIACCSTCYFQRMFSYVTGIPLSEYIRRRRMTQAAFELQSSSQRVLDIALKYGYHSPTSFNRAFQSIHGISPIAAKSEGCALNAYPPVKFSVQVTGGETMTYRIEEKENMRIVGVRIPLTTDMELNQRKVPIFWEKFLLDKRFSAVCSLAAEPMKKVFGITAYQSREEIYYFIAAATDQPAPQGMFEYQIPATTWVIFPCTGPYRESIQRIFQRFLTEWLPFSGYTYAELPDMEIYPIEDLERGNSEVWIGVKKEGKGLNNCL